MGAAEPREDIPDNGQRVLGAGVIGGEHRQVGVFTGGGSHQGALALIPAAAAAEHRNEPSGGQGPGGFQGVFHGVRRVGKVDEHAIAAPRHRYRLHAAGNGGHLSKGTGGVRQGNAGQAGHGQGRQGVVHGEKSGDGHGHGTGDFALPGGEPDAGGGEVHVLCQQAASMKPVVIYGTGAVPENALRPGIVAVYRGGAALAEQGRLGGGVVLHGAVKVQVVPAEIGESGYSIRQAVDPVKCQCVGGDLHHGVGAAGIGHLPQQTLHLPGLRGGAAGGEDRVPDAAAVGAHQAGRDAQGLKQPSRQPGHGGFAVGAGDADQGQLPVRVAEEISRHKG